MCSWARSIFAVLVGGAAVAACGAVATDSLAMDQAAAKGCAPRCVCGPKGEYTWCCSCPSDGRVWLDLDGAVPLRELRLSNDASIRLVQPDAAPGAAPGAP